MTTLRDQIQDALQVGLKQAVPDVANRVFVEIDRQFASGDFPCLNLEVGHATADYQAGGNAGPGDRLVSIEYAVSVDVVCEETWADFRSRSKAIASAVRRALARFDTLMPTPYAADWRFVGEQPVKFPTSVGVAGGYVMTFVATYEICEGDPDTALAPIAGY